MYTSRIIEENIIGDLKRRSILLLGPRRTGKSSMLRHSLKADRSFNLLDHALFTDLARRPSSLRESLKETDRVIAIDEIQKLPQLMDEIHLMIEEQGRSFILTGSSARKLRRTYTGLMAGRARSIYLHPFVTSEIKDYSLEAILSYGTLPGIIFSDTPMEDLRDYVGDYLQQEILAEALTRNIDHYARFLTQSATLVTQILNIEKLANDAQVAPTSVRRFLDILSDTMIALQLVCWSKGKKRKAVSSTKLIFFDVGVVNSLLGVKEYNPRDHHAGWQFEQLVGQELWAFRDYRERDADFAYWRSTHKFEVDYVFGDRVAIEVKHSSNVSERELKGLRAIHEENQKLRRIVVCQEKSLRVVDGIEITPYRQFFEDLWSGKI